MKPSRSPVLYHSAILNKLSPRLAFKKRDSARVAAAAAAADVCRDKFKTERDAAAEMAGRPRAGDTHAMTEERKAERRRLLNRSSACASRLRKEAYCSCLERELEKLESEFMALQIRVRKLQMRETNLVRDAEGRQSPLSGERNVSDTKSDTRRGCAREMESASQASVDGDVILELEETLKEIDWQNLLGTESSQYNNGPLAEGAYDWEGTDTSLCLPPYLL